MPAATPQTASWKIRSHSPPRATQRRPVIQMHAAMPASSISPYMWIVSGPSSRVPEDGEGIDARNATAGILPARSVAARENDSSGGGLEQDRERQLGLA